MARRSTGPALGHGEQGSRLGPRAWANLDCVAVFFLNFEIWSI
jgi:hypothetical protein